MPLRLEFRVSRVEGSACIPLGGALIDVWQCDAQGVYSDVRDINGRFDTRGIFRRGGRQLMLQLTQDEQGYAGRFDIALRKSS